MTSLSPVGLGFLVALVAALLLTPLARTCALAAGAVDRPDGHRKLHARPVPLWGGVALYLSLVLGWWMTQQLLHPVAYETLELAQVLLAAAGFVCLLGAIDDSVDLHPRFKLLLQVGAALPVVASGHYVEQIVAFGCPISLGWLGIPLTVLWLVGCINALNLLDGMDGMASVVGLSTAGMMALIAGTTGHPDVALLCLVLAGAIAGFLIYNLPPASIYLGDSGSMVIGLVLGILGIEGAMKTTTTLSITAPVVMMSIPFLDTVLAVVRRRLTGRPFDSADRGHLHHRLLERGLNVWQVLCLVGTLCLTTGAAATAATIFRNDALAWITVLCLVVLLIRTRAFGHHELTLAKQSLARQLGRIGRRFAGANWRWARREMPLGPVTIDTVWQELVRETETTDIDSLELELFPTGTAPRILRWQANKAAAADDSQAFLTVRWELPGVACQATLTLPAAHGAPRRLIDRLGQSLAELAAAHANPPGMVLLPLCAEERWSHPQREAA